MIRVGPAGWSYADWEGRVYPKRKPPGFHPLAVLARSLDCVELNSSFYATPRADYAESWLRHVADHPDFRFTAKLEGTFTHEPWPADRGELEARVAAFTHGLSPLVAAGRFGALLVQFPLSFRQHPRSLARLERIAEHFSFAPRVLEVRHRSWFTPDALAAVARLGYSVAEIDLPAGPDHPPRDFHAEGELGYLRIHGRNASAWFDAKAGRDQRYDYLYGADEVAGLADRARRLAEGHDETYVVTNNHFAGKAVVNALELLASLGGSPPTGPVELIESYPRLEGLVRPLGQGSLF